MSSSPRLKHGALNNEPDVELRALTAGNDLLITTDHAGSFARLRTALDSGQLSESDLDAHVTRILAWKSFKDLQ